jgi:hypothetical protein
MKQYIFIFLLLFLFIIQTKSIAQLPSNNEVIALMITQKKASDLKNALPFTSAPGSTPKLYPGNYTSLYNHECLAVCSFLQGRDIIQVVLLLYKNKEGFWMNGCWYYDNIYRLKVKDFNKDDILELILETRLSAGNRTFGNYKVISLLNQNTTIWYENNTILGIDQGAVKNSQQGKEISRDIKVTLIDTIQNKPCVIKERTILGKFNSYTVSEGVKLDFETNYQEYRFAEHKYVPIID